ncbi:MAG: M1 family metallopeptidase [Acidobacteriota bacterium]
MRILRLLSLLTVLQIAGAIPRSHATVSVAEKSKHIASYTIDAQLKLDDRGRPAIVEGKARLTWHNDSKDLINELQFHLYLNAFKNEKSTFFRESGGALRGDRFSPGEWGGIDLKEMKLAGEDILKTAEFIQPDDTNSDDQTVLRVRPTRPVRPGETIGIDMVFTSRLPRVFARTGYWGSFAMVGQWFPKIGVWETVGERHRTEAGWNCHQFHANSEFYADFGDYDVTITVPAPYRGKVDGTGDLRSERANPDGTLTYNFVQDDVHDFGWSADTKFIKVIRTFKGNEQLSDVEKASWSERLHISPTEIQLSNVEVILLIQPEHRDQVDRHFRAAFNALKYFGLWYGTYPYKTLAIIDPPYQAQGAGGMEYPTLVTTWTRWRAGRDQNPEEVIIHEIAHQYWYGLVASNEFEEPWMDEGITTYSTAKVLGTAYGSNVLPITIWGFDLFYVPLEIEHPLEDRLLTLRGRLNDPILTPSWKFFDEMSYGLNAYPRSGLMLNTLERYLGEPLMAQIMRTYLAKWRYAHPASQDFFDVVNEVSGKDLEWFFDQYVNGTVSLDYEVADISSTQLEDAASDGPKGFRTELIVRRLGDGWFPVDFELKLTDGRRVTITPTGISDRTIEYRIANTDGTSIVDSWEIDARWKRFSMTTSSAVVEAMIDPDRKVLLDANWTNNSSSKATGLGGGVRWASGALFWAQSLLQALTFIG